MEKRNGDENGGRQTLLVCDSSGEEISPPVRVRCPRCTLKQKSRTTQAIAEAD